MTANFDTVVGCDMSQAMIDKANERTCPADFVVWDGLGQFPLDTKFDAVTSKLSFLYVDNLSAVAEGLSSALVPNGVVVASTPHPLRTNAETASSYWKQSEYRKKVGRLGVYAAMIHRSMTDYLNAFFDNGFILDGFCEPEIDDGVAKKQSVENKDLVIPKRMVLRFRKQ